MLTCVAWCRRQTAEMIKTAAQRPQERKEYLQKCIRELADLPNDPVVKSFGMTVDPAFLKVSLKTFIICC